MSAAGMTATISPVLETHATPRSCRARRQAAIEADLARRIQESRPNLNIKIPRAKKSVKKRRRGRPVASSSSTPASVPVQVVETPSEAQLEPEIVEVIAKRQRKERTVHKCQYCERTFRKNSQKEIHERVHTGERPFVCKHPGCDKRYHRADHLSRHAASHIPHPQRPYKCTICYRNFAQPGKLQRHIKMHETPRPHACNICGETYLKTCVLREHLKNVHGESMPFKCKKQGCGKEFSRFQLLRRHTEKHRMQKKTYTCEAGDCNNVTFSRMIDFQKHIKKTHEKGTCYIEDYVNKNGKNPRLYCQPCDKLFKNPSEKSAHEQKHGMPAFARLSYPCKVSGCIARYTSICNLRIHMRDKHNENIAHVCPECGLQLSTGANLRRHRLTIHKISKQDQIAQAPVPALRNIPVRAKKRRLESDSEDSEADEEEREREQLEEMAMQQEMIADERREKVAEQRKRRTRAKKVVARARDREFCAKKQMDQAISKSEKARIEAQRLCEEAAKARVEAEKLLRAEIERSRQNPGITNSNSQEQEEVVYVEEHALSSWDSDKDVSKDPDGENEGRAEGGNVEDESECEGDEDNSDKGSSGLALGGNIPETVEQPSRSQHDSNDIPSTPLSSNQSNIFSKKLPHTPTSSRIVQATAPVSDSGQNTIGGNFENDLSDEIPLSQSTPTHMLYGGATILVALDELDQTRSKGNNAAVFAQPRPSSAGSQSRIQSGVVQAAPGPSRRDINAQVSGQSHEELSGDNAPSSTTEDQLYEDDHPIQISDKLFDRGMPGGAHRTNSLVEKDCNNDSARAGVSAAHHHLNVNQQVEMQDFIPSGEEERSNAGPAKDIDQSDSEYSGTDKDGSDSYESASSEDESHEESIEENESNIEESDASDEDESYTTNSQDLNDFEGNSAAEPEELNSSIQENMCHIEEDPSPLFALFGDVAHQSSAYLQVQPENNDRPMQPVNVQEDFQPGDDACHSESMQISGYETIARWKDSEVQDSLNGSQLHILKEIRTERPPVPSSLEPLQAKDKECVAFESHSNLKSSDWRQDKGPPASVTTDKRSPGGSPKSVGQDTAPIQNTRKSTLSEDSVRFPAQKPNSDNGAENTGQKTARAIDISGKPKEHNPASLLQITLGKESTKESENNEDVIMKHGLLHLSHEALLHQGTSSEEPRNSWLSSGFHVHSSGSVGSEVLKPNDNAIAAGERATSALEPGASEQHGRITDPELGSSSLETQSVTTNVNHKNPEMTTPPTANPNEREKSPPPPTLAQSAGKAVQQFHPVPMSMKMVTMHTVNIKGSRCASQENPQADKVQSESKREGYSEKAVRIASSIISVVAAPFRGLFRS